MGSRVKEDERNERAVRALVKLPGNRRCVNCNSVGPQYVCTSFSTFICVNCSGIHREFTHRVKSISMAKFTSQEVSALQEGGNERAKEIYFKHYDFKGLPVPDSSDTDRLRNFVKNVYVARRFMGERIGGDSPQVKGNWDDSYGNSSIDSSKGAIRSIHGETSEESHGPHHSTERTSENQSNLSTHTISGGMDQKNKSTTGRENASVRSYQRLDDVQKTSGGSEYNQKDVATLVSSVPKPSKDTSGVVLPIKLPDPPRSRKASTSIANTKAQKAAVPMTDDPSSGSTRVATVDFSKSLIDFDSDMEPRQGGVQTKMQNNTSLPSGYAGWTTFDVGTPKKATINSLVAPRIQVPNSVSAPQSGFPTVQTAKSLSFSQTNHGLQQHLSPVDNIQTNYPPFNRANTGPVNVQGIFTMSYRPVYASAWDWQANSRINMGYGQYDMQYPAGAVNFPSVASRAPSMGPVGSFLSPPQVPIALTANTNQYMIHRHEVNVPHQVHSNTYPVGYQGARGLATTASADGLYLVDQRMSTQNLQAMTQSSLPRVGGNPFA